MEGKLVKYKNMKRVIKLPAGRQAIVEIPTEVISFPQVHMSAEDEEETEQQVSNFSCLHSKY
jgi:dsDNA-specific endonuclease/ATPase MutS2